MSERDGYEAGVPCWVAAILPDPEKAVGFYTQLFGWEARETMPPGSPGKYFICTLRDRDVAAFGWETDACDMDEGEITMWRVPGYVGGEPEQPGSREVVGVMVPASGP